MKALNFFSKTNRMKNTLLSGSFMLWILACGSSGSNFERGTTDSKSVAPSMEENLQGGSPQSPGTIQVEQQKIIRNGSMNISVKNAPAARQELNHMLEKNKAYVGNEQLNNTDYETTYSIQIRVPAEHLDSLVADIEALTGTVTFKSIEAKDVTEEYIDLESRLTNKKAYLEQYRTLLKSAHSIEDILKVQEQIRVLEEEIESVTGRLKYLNNQIDLSTLQLTISETKDYVYRPDRRINFFERLKESISGGWYGFVNFILNVVVLWPFWLVLIALIWLLTRYNKKQAKKKHQVPPVP
jgi:hypothetical protein